LIALRQPLCVIICRNGCDDVTDPAQEAAGTNPKAGGDDQPEDPTPEGAVVELTDTGDDEAKDCCCAGRVMMPHNLSAILKAEEKL